jgi:hypothetical protein
MTLLAANGGWVRVTIDDEPPFDVRVRPNERGRLRIIELRLGPGGPIDSNTLRRVQLARVEAQVNGAASLRERIIAGLELPATMEFDWKFVSAGAQIDQRITTAATGHKVVATRAKRPTARLHVPTSNPKPARFYKQVAELYIRLTDASRRPAAELAEAAGVPVSTAHRWVREARRRGFLPPGQRGFRG